MRSIIRRPVPFSLMLLLAVTGIALGQPRAMEAGKHYDSISPAIATQAPADVIEILDVFWYGCPVCGEFEPMMTYYGEQIRGDLTLRRMPAVWNPLMKLHAQLYYTAVELEVAAQAHPAAFRWIQEEAKPLATQEQVRDFFLSLGVTEEAFAQAWHSEVVTAQVARAEQDTRAAGVERLPALVLNGRYRVIRNEHAPELTEVVIIANQLIKTLRDERRPD